MINEENRPEDTQQPLSSNPMLDDPENETGVSDTPVEVDRAIEQFRGIKQALIGSEPEWVLPAVNEKALASKP